MRLIVAYLEQLNFSLLHSSRTYLDVNVDWHDIIIYFFLNSIVNEMKQPNVNIQRYFHMLIRSENHFGNSCSSAVYCQIFKEQKN